MNYRIKSVRLPNLVVGLCLLVFTVQSCKKDEGKTKKDDDENITPNWAISGGDMAWSGWGGASTSIADMELIGNDLYVAFSSGYNKLMSPLYVSRSGGNWELLDSGIGVLTRNIEQGYNGNLYTIDDIYDKYAGWDRNRYVFKKWVNYESQLLDTVASNRPDMPPGSGEMLDLSLVYTNNRLLAHSSRKGSFWRVTSQDSVEKDPTSFINPYWGSSKFSHAGDNKAYYLNGGSGLDPLTQKRPHSARILSYDGITSEEGNLMQWDVYGDMPVSFWNQGTSLFRTSSADNGKTFFVENFETGQKVYDVPEGNVLSSLYYETEAIHPISNRETVLILSKQDKVQKLLFHDGNNFSETDWKLPPMAGIPAQDPPRPVLVLKKNGSLYAAFKLKNGHFYVVKNF